MHLSWECDSRYRPSGDMGEPGCAPHRHLWSGPDHRNRGSARIIGNAPRPAIFAHTGGPCEPWSVPRNLSRMLAAARQQNKKNGSWLHVPRASFLGWKRQPNAAALGSRSVHYRLATDAKDLPLLSTTARENALREDSVITACQCKQKRSQKRRLKRSHESTTLERPGDFRTLPAFAHMRVGDKKGGGMCVHEELVVARGRIGSGWLAIVVGPNNIARSNSRFDK